MAPPASSTRSITSRRSAARSDRTAHRPLQPFTVDHFRRYARLMVLEGGRRWEPEDWQLSPVEDLFAGYRAVWLVVPEGNGKTTLTGGVILYFGDHTPEPWIPVGASSGKQAGILFGQAAGFVARTPGLSKRFKVQEGTRRIMCLRTQTVKDRGIQIFAADDNTGDGVIPTLAAADELHRMKNLSLYRTWEGKLDKRSDLPWGHGQILGLSTAGEPGSEFEETRAAIVKAAVDTTKRGPYIRAATEDMVLHDWAVRDRRKAGDMKVVADANPLGSITAERLMRKRRAPTMTDEHWQRFVCNIATRISGQAILPEEWDELRDPDVGDVIGAPRLGWLDLGWKIDTTAMGVLVWESDQRRLVLGVNVLEPPVEESDVVNGLVDLQEEFQPEAFVYDPRAGGAQMAQLLEKGEHPVQVARSASPMMFIEHSQDNAPQALAAVRLDEAIRAKWLVHDGDPVLRLHALNAAKKALGGEKWRYDRPSDAKGERRRKFPIDALTGLSMGHSIACEMFSEGARWDGAMVEVFG